MADVEKVHILGKPQCAALSPTGAAEWANLVSCIAGRAQVMQQGPYRNTRLVIP